MVNDLKKNKIISNATTKQLLESNPIKCYSYVNQISMIKRYSNLTNLPETNITCRYDDSCVKYTIKINDHNTAIWKGCFSTFQLNIGRMYGNYILNSCFVALNDNEESICICSDNDYCNSQPKKIFFYYVTYIIVLFILFF